MQAVDYCGQQEESAILISMLLLHMRHIYVASSTKNECNAKNAIDQVHLDPLSLVIWSCMFWLSVKGNLHKAQQWSKSIFTFWSLSPAAHNLWLSLVIAYMYYIIGTTHNSLATKWPYFYSAQWFNKLYYHVTIRQ